MTRMVQSKSRGFTVQVCESAGGVPLSGWERNGKFFWRGRVGLQEGTYPNARTFIPRNAIGIHPNDWKEV